MGEVINLDVVTSIDLPPDRILEAAMGEYESVFVIGYGHDGEIDMRSSLAGGPELLWLLKKAERQLLAIGEDD